MNLIKATLVLSILLSATCYAGGNGRRGGSSNQGHSKPSPLTSPGGTALVAADANAGTFDPSVLPQTQTVSALGLGGSSSSSTGELPADSSLSSSNNGTQEVTSASLTNGSPDESGSLTSPTTKNGTALDKLARLANEKKNPGRFGQLAHWAGKQWDPTQRETYVTSPETRIIHSAVQAVIDEHSFVEYCHHPDFISFLSRLNERQQVANQIIVEALSGNNHELAKRILLNAAFLLSPTNLKVAQSMLEKNNSELTQAQLANLTALDHGKRRQG